MLERFDLVVFDWDGTLVNSTAFIARAIQLAAADLGLAVPSDEQASHVIGLGLHEALRRAVPDLPEERLRDFVERYRVHYFARESDLVLFEGVRDMVDALRDRGVRMAVATGKNSNGLSRALDQTGLRPYFATTRCADQTFSKPHPAMLIEITDELGVERSRTLMIGDTTHDLQMAAAAGTAAVGVTYGAHPRQALHALAPLAVVDTVAELRGALFAS